MNLRYPAFLAVLPLAFALAACGDEPPTGGEDGGGEDGGGDGGDGGTPLTEDCGDYEDNDDDGLVDCADDDCEGETECPVLEPAALGVEINTGYDADNNVLTYYMYDGFSTIYNPVLTLTVTDIEYFSMSADDPDREYHYCEFYAEFPHVEPDPAPVGHAFDYDKGHGTGDGTFKLQYFAEGRADIYSYQVATDSAGNPLEDDEGNYYPSRACESLLAQGYPDVLDGMHVGIGFGELSPYMRESYWSDFAGDYAIYEESVLGTYVAFNHPADNADGYDFVAYDWASAIFWGGALQTLTLTDSEGNEFDADVFVATVDGSGYLEFGIAGASAFVRTYAYWYEDYPNFDLGLLKEGVPTLP